MFFLLFLLSPFLYLITSITVQYRFYCYAECVEIIIPSDTIKWGKTPNKTFTSFPTRDLVLVNYGNKIKLRIYVWTGNINGFSGYIQLDKYIINTNQTVDFFNGDNNITTTDTYKRDNGTSYKFLKTNCPNTCYITITVPSNKAALIAQSAKILNNEYTCNDITIYASIYNYKSFNLKQYISPEYSLHRYSISWTSISGEFLDDNNQIINNKELITTDTIKYKGGTPSITEIVSYHVTYSNTPDIENCLDASITINICNENCTSCDSSSLCLHCHDDYAFINATSICLHMNDISDDYYCYDDNGDQRCKPCYKRCAQCTLKGNDNDHLCEECLSPYDYYYYIQSTNTFNCYEECAPRFQIENSYNCSDSCPMSHPIVSYDRKSCVYQCEENYIANKDNRCVYDFELREEREKDIITAKPIEEMKSILNETVFDMIEVNNTMRGDDYAIQVYPSNFPFANDGLAYLDISQCESVLRRHYNIPDDEEIIIAKIDYLINNTVDYYVYDINWNFLSLAPCEGISSEISFPFDNGINNDMGVNVFDKDDPFFTDICVPYVIKGRDVPLKARIELYYVSNNYCEDTGCEYGDISYINHRISCKCIINGSEKEKEKEIKYKVMNFEVVKCFFLIQKWKYIKENVAFWIYGTILILIFVFSIWGINTMESKMILQIYQRVQGKAAPVIIVEEYFEKENSSSKSIIMKTEDDYDKTMSKIKEYQIIKSKQNIFHPYSIAKDNNFNFITIFIDVIKINLLQCTQKPTIYTHLGRILLFLLFISTSFGVNVIMYINPYIYWRYSNEGNFLYSFMRSFFAFIISEIGIKCAYQIYSISDVIDSYIVEIEDEDTLMILIGKIVKKYKIKFFIGFIVNIVFILILFVYATSFNIVYPALQIQWSIEGIFSAVLYIVIHSVYSLLIATLMWIAIRGEHEALYNFSLSLMK